MSTLSELQARVGTFTSDEADDLMRIQAALTAEAKIYFDIWDIQRLVIARRAVRAGFYREVVQK